MTAVDKAYATLRSMEGTHLGPLAADIKAGLDELAARVAAGQDAAKYGKVDDFGQKYVEADGVIAALFGPLPEHPDTMRVRKALSTSITNRDGAVRTVLRMRRELQA